MKNFYVAVDRQKKWRYFITFVYFIETKILSIHKKTAIAGLTTRRRLIRAPGYSPALACLITCLIMQSCTSHERYVIFLPIFSALRNWCSTIAYYAWYRYTAVQQMFVWGKNKCKNNASRRLCEDGLCLHRPSIVTSVLCSELLANSASVWEKHPIRAASSLNAS